MTHGLVIARPVPTTATTATRATITNGARRRGRTAGAVPRRALAAVAGGALIGVDLWKSAALAGIMACAQVIEKLLRFSVDGSLTKEEIELAFTGAVKAKPEVAE